MEKKLVNMEDIKIENVKKKIFFFSALRASFWSKNKGGWGPPGPSPGSATGLATPKIHERDC